MVELRLIRAGLSRSACKKSAKEILVAVVVTTAILSAFAGIANAGEVPKQPNYTELSPRLSIGSIKIVDLSHSIAKGIPTFFGPFGEEWGTYENVYTWESGYYYNRLNMTENTGTQIDSPAHFVPGQTSVGEIPLAQLSGIAVVMDAKELIMASGNWNYSVTREDIVSWENKTEVEIKEGYIFLLHTGWDEYWNSYVRGNSTRFMDSWPSLDASGAEYLIEKKIKGWGVDTPSQDIAPSQTFPVHYITGQNGTWALENLDDIGQLPSYSYVIVSPMKIKGGSGGPTRVWSLFDRNDPKSFAESLNENFTFAFQQGAAFDLAHSLENGIPIFGGRWWGVRTQFNYTPDGFLLTGLNMTEHTGTHMDAPAHFAKGKWYIDEIPLDRLFGEAVVMNLSGLVKVSGNSNYSVTMEDIKNWEASTEIEIKEGDIVLMYTGWEEKWDDVLSSDNETYIKEWPALNKSGAEYLRSKKIKGFGLDTLSLDPAPSTEFEAHHILLGDNIWGLENVDNLKEAGLLDKRIYIAVMPWMLWHGSGGPARVWAFDGQPGYLPFTFKIQPRAQSESTSSSDLSAATQVSVDFVIDQREAKDSLRSEAFSVREGASTTSLNLRYYLRSRGHNLVQ